MDVGFCAQFARLEEVLGGFEEILEVAFNTKTLGTMIARCTEAFGVTVTP